MAAECSGPCFSLQHHWGVNGGKCGICGDAYDRPREHEAGGKYATGTIVRSYRAGQVMPILIQITSKYHLHIVSLFVLTHWSRHKMSTISPMTFSSAFSCVEIYKFRIKFNKVKIQ